MNQLSLLNMPSRCSLTRGRRGGHASGYYRAHHCRDPDNAGTVQIFGADLPRWLKTRRGHLEPVPLLCTAASVSDQRRNTSGVYKALHCREPDIAGRKIISLYHYCQIIIANPAGVQCQ
jgi:hypothetical protein